MRAMVGESMAFLKTDPERSGGIGASLTQLADGIGKLITQHFQLAKLELTEDAKVIGALVARIAVFVPFVLVGYALLMVALSVLLARVLPLDAALGIVGGVNVIGGGIGIYLAAQGLKSKNLLDESMQQLKSTAALAKSEAIKP
jgi:uncharacterized membrane protein YqjE